MNIYLWLPEFTIKNFLRILKIVFFDKPRIPISDRHKMPLDHTSHLFWLFSIPRLTSTTGMIGRGFASSRCARGLLAGLSLVGASFWWNIQHSSGDHNSIVLSLISYYQLQLFLFLIEWSLNLIFVLLHSSYRPWSTNKVLVSTLIHRLLNGFLFCWYRKFVYIVFFGRLRWFPLHRTLESWVLSLNQQWPVFSRWVCRFILLLLYFAV